MKDCTACLDGAIQICGPLSVHTCRVHEKVFIGIADNDQDSARVSFEYKRSWMFILHDTQHTFTAQSPFQKSCYTLGSVGSRTQLSLRCNFSDYVLRNNYVFRPMVGIFKLSWE